jgi:Flp pilus assembly protein TadD
MSTDAEILEQLEFAEELKLQGQSVEALRILEQLCIQEPENASIFEEIADNELHLEHFERALKAANHALELDSESYTAHYIIGFLESQKSEHDSAISHLQTANRLKPNNPEILRCLGWALFCNNQSVRGIVTLERALNLDNENPLILCDLGVTYLQSKNISKATNLFQKALELDPDNERAQECIKAATRVQEYLQKAAKKTVRKSVVKS